MHRSAVLLALGALTSPATAGWFKSNEEPSWSPPRQTGIYGEEAGERGDLAMGWSPKPTGAPALSGAMDLKFALGKRALKSNTCGFGEVGNSFTCVTSNNVCSYSDNYVGCCETGRSCNIIKTTCVDYTDSASICKFVDDFHTMCCDSALPSCFSWVGKTKGEDYTILSCGASGGTSLLLFSDPLAETSSADSSTTDASSTTDDNSSSTTSEATASSTEADNDDDDGPNVGAIAGGTVGGVAALALVGLAGFLLFRRRKKTTPATTPLAADSTQGAPPMAQHPQSPGNSFVPSSPSNATYPSGVPQNFQGYQQAYDPNLATPYGQPQGYQQPGYGGYSPQPQNPQGQYPQQGFGQQNQYPSQYGVGGYGAPSSTSPPPGQFTPSPGPKDGGEAPLGGHQQQHHAQELPAVNPIGNEGNRAELS